MVNRMIFEDWVAAVAFLFHSTRDCHYRAWCTALPSRKPRNDIFSLTVPLTYPSIGRARFRKALKSCFLFLNFHFFPAAKEFPFPTASHNKFRAANRTNVSFANLICHVVDCLPFKLIFGTKVFRIFLSVPFLKPCPYGCVAKHRQRISIEGA
jgi:hypothetical protein